MLTKDDSKTDGKALRSANANDVRYSSTDSIRQLQLEQARVHEELCSIRNSSVEQQNCNDEQQVDDDELAEFQRLETELKTYELEKKLDIINERIRLKLFEQLSTGFTSTCHVSSQSPSSSLDSTSNSPSNNSNSNANSSSNSHDIADSYATVVHHRVSPILGPILLRPRQFLDQTHILTSRPLTLYLPKPNEQINLLEHIQTLGHDPILISVDVHITASCAHGYLWKACSRATNKWNRRYFLFDRAARHLAYYQSERDLVKRAHEPKQIISFDEICDIYVDHKRISTEEKRSTRRFVFILATKERKYALASPKPETMRVWIDVIFTATQSTELIV